MFMFLFECNNMPIWICHDVSTLGLYMLRCHDKCMLVFGMKSHVVCLDGCLCVCVCLECNCKHAFNEIKM